MKDDVIVYPNGTLFNDNNVRRVEMTAEEFDEINKEEPRQENVDENVLTYTTDCTNFEWVEVVNEIPRPLPTSNDYNPEIRSLIKDYEKISKPNFDSKVIEYFDYVFSFDEYFGKIEKRKRLYNSRDKYNQRINCRKTILSEKEKVLSLIDLEEIEMDVENYQTITKKKPKKHQELLLLTSYGYGYEELLNMINGYKAEIANYEAKIKTIEYDITEIEVYLEEDLLCQVINDLIKKYSLSIRIIKKSLNHVVLAGKKIDDWISIGISYNHKGIIKKDIFLYNEEKEDYYQKYYPIISLFNSLLNRINQ